MKVTIWKTVPGFKIRRKADIKFFFDRVCCDDNTYVIRVNEDKVLIIRKDKDGDVTVSVKLWDIYNVFNPELELYDERVKTEIWNCRKAVNAYFFGDN